MKGQDPLSSHQVTQRMPVPRVGPMGMPHRGPAMMGMGNLVSDIILFALHVLSCHHFVSSFRVRFEQVRVYEFDWILDAFASPWKVLVIKQSLYGTNLTCLRSRRFEASITFCNEVRVPLNFRYPKSGVTGGSHQFDVVNFFLVLTAKFLWLRRGLCSQVLFEREFVCRWHGQDKFRIGSHMYRLSPRSSFTSPLRF